MNTFADLINEMQEAVTRKDDTAVTIAALNIVGRWLELQERNTAALEDIARMALHIQYANGPIYVSEWPH